MPKGTFKQTWLVASWEFMHFFKWKQELISKLIMLGVGVVVFLWQTVKQDFTDEYTVAVKTLAPITLEVDKFKFVVVTDTLEQLKTDVSEEKFDAVIIEQESDSELPELALYSLDKQSWQQELQSELKGYYKNTYTDSIGLTQAQLDVIKNGANFDLHYLDETVKQQSQTSESLAQWMLLMIAIGVFTSFGQLFVSVTGEKQQRVTEQLYSCISPQTWIDGKIFGQMFHAIKAMVSFVITVLLVMAFTAVVIKGESVDFSFIDWSLLPWLVIFAVAGIYFCTSFMAAIAAAIDDPNHSAKSTMMLLPLLPLIITLISLDSPSGWALTFLSFFPLTAFAAMPVKMALIDVPLWQPVVALAGSILVCFWIRKGAARLFKMCMTMYGKEPKVLDMCKWFIKDPS